MSRPQLRTAGIPPIELINCLRQQTTNSWITQQEASNLTSSLKYLLFNGIIPRNQHDPTVQTVRASQVREVFEQSM